MKHKCLTEDEIAAYVDGVADAKLRKRVEQHIAECNFCLHTIAELKQLVEAHESHSVPATPRALAQARSVIASHIKTSLPELQIAAIFKKGICRILESTGSLLAPQSLAAIPMRSARARNHRPRIAKSLSGYLVTVELVPSKDSLTARLTLIEEASSTKPDGIKAKLYTRGSCETKYSRKGKLTFSSLTKGSFDIDLEGVGRIKLEIQ